MSFDRKIIQLNFSKIYKVKDLTEEKCEEFVAYAYNNFPYRERQKDDNDLNKGTITSGFNDEFINSYKIKNNQIIYDKPLTHFKINSSNLIKPKTKNTKTNHKTQEKIMDKKFNIIKTTYARKQDYSNKNQFVDVFLMPELDLVSIVGSEDYVESPMNIIQDFFLENKIEYEDINVQHDFILWMIWKINSNPQISPKLYIQNFQNLGSSRNPNEGVSRVPFNIKTKDSAQTNTSFPITYGLINNHFISMLRGNFKLNNDKFVIDFLINSKTENENQEELEDEDLLNENNDIIQTSQLHILAEKSLEGKFYSEKLKLCLPLIYLLTELLLKWENIEATKKYPPINYIDEMWDKMKEEFDTTEKNFKKFKLNHCVKLRIECEKMDN